MTRDICKTKNDEYYTPKYAVIPLIKYIKKESTIWCPFDKPESEFVKVFTNNGANVIYSHIDSGEDFFEIPFKNCDYVISNPPYSQKIDVLEKLFEYGKPFAMLIGIEGLFDGKRKIEMLKNNKFEILVLSKRINYLSSNKKIKSNVPYASIYLCHNILPKQIVFEEIDKNV